MPTISAILNQVACKDYTLPEFQRGFVWGRDDVRKLFESLYREFPVGGFLVWTTVPDEAMVRGGAPAGAVKLLLDGQQRATSLYGVMRGQAPEFFRGDKRAFTDLYFNVQDEIFEFYGPVKMRDDPLWVSVTNVFESKLADVVKSLAPHINEPDLLLEYQVRLAKLRDLEKVNLPVEEIGGGERHIDEVVEIFNRVNTGGTTLSSADIALARVCAHSPDARDKLNSRLRRWSQDGFKFRLEWLLRCVTVVATGKASYNSLGPVSPSEFFDALKKAEQSIDFLLNLLHDWLGIDDGRILPSSYALIVPALLVARSGGSIADADEQRRVLFWYLHCAMWGRYSGSTETRIQRDLETLDADGVEGLITELDQWRGSLEVRPEDFDNWSIGARFYPLLYILTRVLDARNLCDNLQLHLGKHGIKGQLQLHHIFPKKRLYDAEYNYNKTQVNALANFCFLTAECNQKIGAAWPEAYFAECKANNPGVLKSQWIPEDPELWSVDRYPDFLAARRSLLADATNELLGRLRTGNPGIRASETEPARHHATTVDSDTPEPQAARDDEEDEIAGIVALARRLGIAPPEPHYEVCDDETGDVLATTDLAWPQGVQPGRTQPVALLAPDHGAEAHLGERGWSFCTSKQRLVWYLEKVLGIDIDGDEIIGEVEPADVLQPSAWTQGPK